MSADDLKARLLEYCSDAQTVTFDKSFIAEAADRIEALEAALRPFADIADTDDEVGRDDPDDDRIWVIQAHGCQLAEMSVGDFRRARQALGENNHG